MGFFRKFLTALYRLWFYVLMAIPILAFLPILLIVSAREKWYPGFYWIARFWAAFILFGMGFYPKVRSAQKLTWENKLAKGFNTSEVPLEFCLLQGEVAEAFDAWRRTRDNLGEELADIAIYVMSLAEMTGIDLQSAVEQKLTKNAKRTYVKDETSGILVKVDPA